MTDYIGFPGQWVRSALGVGAWRRKTKKEERIRWMDRDIDGRTGKHEQSGFGLGEGWARLVQLAKAEFL